jgi:hypothetical protein
MVRGETMVCDKLSSGRKGESFGYAASGIDSDGWFAFGGCKVAMVEDI